MTNRDDEVAWPDTNRPLFAPGDAASLNAAVGWVISRRTDMRGHVEGYRRAATSVFEACAARRMSPEYAVWPLAFLWRHHIELALKQIIAKGRLLEGEPWGFPPHHRLLPLWQGVRKVIKNCGAGETPELDTVETTIGEIDRLDPNSDGFRYPSDMKGDPSLPGVPDTVSLRPFHEAMESLATFLDAVEMEISVQLDRQLSQPG